jgi:NADH dehydrogenase FAD-containing subunit
VHAAGNVTNANPHFVLGAGYTGMTAAIGLARRTRNHDVTVRLVNPAARFTERLRLHQVASGQSLAELQIPDMLAGTGVDFVQGWVTAIDTGTRAVRVDDQRILHYDTLVYAMGTAADTARVPGADENAYTLDSLQDAELFAATLRDTDAEAVAVIGGGLTGVEAAAEPRPRACAGPAAPVC